MGALKSTLNCDAPEQVARVRVSSKDRMPQPACTNSEPQPCQLIPKCPECVWKRPACQLCYYINYGAGMTITWASAPGSTWIR